MPYRLISVFESSLSDLSDTSRPHGDQPLSSNKLLVCREFFVPHADDVTIDARDFATFPDWDKRYHDPSSLCDDAASDIAEYGDSVQYHSSSHEHSDLRVIGTRGFKQGNPLSAPSVTRNESERFAPNNAQPLGEGDTFLDLAGDPSRSVSKS
ncbi:hypothetical protein EI94DRAFT_1736289 [Lactarius quietus]|nr:hypothetical protein EI94DRAFT_1736289 [Lactarius quietus]